MSVIVRGPDGKVKVLAKGADTTMMPLLREDTPKVLLILLLLCVCVCILLVLAACEHGSSWLCFNLVCTNRDVI